MARRPQQERLRWVQMQAPMGGLNAIDAGPAVPVTDCLELINMVPSARGMKVRNGSIEWVTGLTGAASNAVRTTMPFTGSTANGSNNKLFVTTSSGIWDVSASTTTPTISIAFTTTSGDAGWGVFHTASTQAGRFLYYCDEVNGLYIYTETANTWAKVASGVTQAWAANTDYEVGNQVVNGGRVYVCDTDGRSAASGGPTGTTTNIADGTTRWDYVSAASTTVIGPSLSDQQAGLSGNPANFVYVMAFKSRIWFVERDTSRGWYLDTSSIYGTVTSFDFGLALRAGGPLVGLYNWTYDAGAGPDDRLVAIASSGSLVVYEGTDPASASTFRLVGLWYVGGVPAGRRIATDLGGHLLILARRGAVPINKLVAGADLSEASTYATRKIAPLFADDMERYSRFQGWALVEHTPAAVLLVLVPQGIDVASEQRALGLDTGGWSKYEDLPMVSAAMWEGELYFGTEDGRVMRHTGNMDELKLADSTAYTPITWKLISGFADLGGGRQVMVKQFRPVLRSRSSVVSITVTARYDYDETVADTPSLTLGTGPNDWGTGLFGTARWSATTPTNSLRGAAGCGSSVAVAVTGKSISETTLIEVGVGFEVGGLM